MNGKTQNFFITNPRALMSVLIHGGGYSELQQPIRARSCLCSFMAADIQSSNNQSERTKSTIRWYDICKLQMLKLKQKYLEF